MIFKWTRLSKIQVLKFVKFQQDSPSFCNIFNGQSSLKEKSMKVLTFSTSIRREKDALNISNLLLNYFGLKSAKINWEDEDRIILVEGKNIMPKKIEQTLDFLGFKCRLIN